MNQFELHVNGQLRRFCGPSTWSELSPRQAVGLARLRVGLAHEPGLAIAALTMLYGVKATQLRWLMDEAFLRYHGIDGDELELTLGMGAELLSTLQWVGEADPQARFVVNRFRVNDYRFGTPMVLLKRILQRTTYHGPSDGLGSLTFGEFMWADAAYRRGDSVELAAILYRPSGQVFDKAGVQKRTKAFGNLDAGLVATITRQYEDSLRYLARCFPHVFPQSATPESKKTPANRKSAGWLDISLAMAQLDVTKIPGIESTNLYLALKALDRQLQQAEERSTARPT